MLKKFGATGVLPEKEGSFYGDFSSSIDFQGAYDLVDKISEMYGIKIVKLNNGDVPTLVRKYGRFPSNVARFCTDELKIKVLPRIC